MRYFEDIEVGDTHDCGSATVTEEEIVEFARQYDPQPFHVDHEAAEESVFDGLIASGWHTGSICTRLLVEGCISKRASQGGIGLDELRWYRPVRPGDTISVDVEVVGKEPSESRPEIGIVRTKLVGRNGRDERVISWIGIAVIERREPYTGGAAD